jgi:hypothetical protein
MFGVVQEASAFTRLAIGALRISGNSHRHLVSPAQRDCYLNPCISTGSPSDKSRQVDKAPALQLRAVAEVGILREGIVLPAVAVASASCAGCRPCR